MFNKCALYYINSIRDLSVEPTCISEQSCGASIEVDDQHTFTTYCNNGRPPEGADLEEPADPYASTHSLCDINSGCPDGETCELAQVSLGDVREVCVKPESC